MSLIKQGPPQLDPPFVPSADINKSSATLPSSTGRQDTLVYLLLDVDNQNTKILLSPFGRVYII